MSQETTNQDTPSDERIAPSAMLITGLRGVAEDWRPTRFLGVRYRSLRYDKSTGAGAVIIEMAANTTYGRHRHHAGEDVLVLGGELLIGTERYSAGSYLYSPPGSTHTPRTEQGCLLFATFPGRVEHLEPSK